MAKVSEVIKRLQELTDEHGDLPIFIRCDRGDGRILDAQLDIYRTKAQPGFLFEIGLPERIVIDGDA